MGALTLDGLPAAPAGSLTIEVKFDVDAHGMLRVSVTETSSGRTIRRLVCNINGYKQEEVERLVIEAETHKQRDDLRRKQERERGCLLRDAYRVFELACHPSRPDLRKMTATRRSFIQKTCLETVQWCHLHFVEDELASKRREWGAVCGAVLRALEEEDENERRAWRRALLGAPAPANCSD